MLIGCGWGIGGLCAAPAFTMLAIATVPIHVIWLGSTCIGMGIAGRIVACTKKDKETEKKDK